LLHVGGPNHAVGMEGRIGLAAREGELSVRLNSNTVGRSRVQSGPVTTRARSTKDRRRPYLQNVCFAAARPGDRGDVAAEGPKGRPKALVRGIGQLDLTLDAAVLEIHKPLGFQASRIPSCTHCKRLNKEVSTAVNVRVGVTRRKSGGTPGRIVCKSRGATINLDFVIAKAAVSGIETPNGLVRRRRGSRVKFLAESWSPDHTSLGIIGYVVADAVAALRVSAAAAGQEQKQNCEKEAAPEKETIIHKGVHRLSLPLY